MLPLIAMLAAVAVYLLVPASPAPRLDGMMGKGADAHPRGSPPPVLARVRPGAERRMREARSRATLTALTALAAELRAGPPPPIALVNASTTVWPTAVAAVRLDGDIAAALRLDAAHAPILRSLAACWEAGVGTGGGLADAVDRLAASHRDAEEVRGQLAVELAGPRATARALIGLPLIGIALGMLLGADPIGFLLGSAVGWACLGAGVALVLLGVWWTNRIAARVEAQL